MSSNRPWNPNWQYVVVAQSENASSLGKWSDLKDCVRKCTSKFDIDAEAAEPIKYPNGDVQGWCQLESLPDEVTRKPICENRDNVLIHFLKLENMPNDKMEVEKICCNCFKIYGIPRESPCPRESRLSSEVLKTLSTQRNFTEVYRLVNLWFLEEKACAEREREIHELLSRQRQDAYRSQQNHHFVGAQEYLKTFYPLGYINMPPVGSLDPSQTYGFQNTGIGPSYPAVTPPNTGYMYPNPSLTPQNPAYTYGSPSNNNTPWVANTQAPGLSFHESMRQDDQSRFIRTLGNQSLGPPTGRVYPVVSQNSGGLPVSLASGGAMTEHNGIFFSGLPYSWNLQKVEEWLKSKGLKHEGIKLHSPHDFKGSGTVQFSDAAQARNAVEALKDSFFGDRPVNVRIDKEGRKVGDIDPMVFYKPEDDKGPLIVRTPNTGPQ